jgi:hypothetical protein
MTDGEAINALSIENIDSNNQGILESQIVMYYKSGR